MIEILQDRPLIVVSCIKTPYDSALTHLHAFFSTKPGDWTFQETFGRFILGKVCTGMPPAGGKHSKRIGVIDKRSFTILVANLQDGWQSLAFMLSKKTRTEAYIFTLSDGGRLEHPINAFTYVSCGKTIRHVSSIKEDEWIFHQQGDPLPEEDEGSGKNPRMPYCFGPDSVAAIGCRLGFDISNLSFFEAATAGMFSGESSQLS